MFYRIVRNQKDRTVTIKEWFFIVRATYSGAWWDESDEAIFRDYIEDLDSNI